VRPRGMLDEMADKFEREPAGRRWRGRGRRRN
jgi:hypothetical protein